MRQNRTGTHEATRARGEKAHLMELLAPVGHMESFHAAIEAGADALYLGLEEHNARLRARNFSIETLSYLIPYAQKRGVKVHVAINTLVKQQELTDVLNRLHQLAQIGADALIVRDLAVIELARRNFPDLALHGSTQMTIHNSLGMQYAASLGLKRIILARELSLAEIEAIASRTRLELEVFVHGALCYSLSGLCLASSYLGGHSGNRGRCTQVCRRRFGSADRDGFLFSPRDFCALEYLPDFARLGITCLKIEGRMRSAEYVWTTVSAYRRAIGDPGSIPEVRSRLQHDFGREKTDLFLSGTPGGSSVLDPSRPAGTGILLGTVSKVTPGRFEMATPAQLRQGDRIRLHEQDGSEGRSMTVAAASRQRGKLIVGVKDASGVRKGASVFLVSRKSPAQKAWSRKRVDQTPARFQRTFPDGRRAVAKYATRARGNYRRSKEDTLYLRVDSLEWLRCVDPVPCERVILACERRTLEELAKNRARISVWAPRIAVSLPPFIPEADISGWRETVDRLTKAGVTAWQCSQPSQKALLPRNADVIAGPTVWCTNTVTRKVLRREGFWRFSYSLEDDVLNVKSLAGPDGVMTLFCYPPLFISRIKPDVVPGSCLADSKGYGFFTAGRHGLHYFIGDTPVCLTHRRDRLREMGISTFLLDFSFCHVSRKTVKLVLAHYEERKKMDASTLFNHKAGLK